MTRRRRIVAAALLALALAPGTWWRTPVSWRPPGNVAIEQISGPHANSPPGWEVAGVWRYEARSLLFGGYSALLALPDGRLEAFSDRGGRFLFAVPDGARSDYEITRAALFQGYENALVDIEAATRDAMSGAYWLSFENTDGIHRFAIDHSATGVRPIAGRKLGWSANSGAEAMVRLADGRFVLLPEGDGTALLFPGDPIDNPDFAAVAYVPPIAGYATTDMAQLPDGRLLVLLRNLDFSLGIPPFASAIAIADPPRAGEKFAPRPLLDLDRILPRENYEGVALHPRDDGRIDVWLISDDNMSIFQRTLVAKLILDPALVD